MARIDPPPPRQEASPLFVELSPDEDLVRIFNPQRPWKPGPFTFNYHAAYSRFDPHVPGEERGALYAGRTLSCCIVEVFGEDRILDNPSCQAVLFRLTRPVTLLDLTGDAAMRAGTLSALSAVPDRALTQQWARYFYETYEECEGLRYHGAHNNEECFVFFDRSEKAFPAAPIAMYALNAPVIYPSVVRTAERCALRLYF